MTRLLTPGVVSVGRAVPPHYVTQEEITEAFKQAWGQRNYNVDRIADLHRATQVKGRYLALPIREYDALKTFAQKNEAWTRAAVELGEKATRDALDRAGLKPQDIDCIIFATLTGIASPSIDARLVNRMGMRPDIRRMPSFGLGCGAGAGGMAWAADYLRAYPTHRALLLTVEVCSLTLQREDVSIPNIIAAGLFGDGAAAVVLEGAQVLRPQGMRGPRVMASKSHFYPDTERYMGWDMMETGFRVLLNPKVPELAREKLGGNVDAFLAEQGLRKQDIRHWVAHTGGPKVLQAFETALGVPSSALERSWRSLREVGNLSSASVLYVLGDFMESGEPREGDWGVMLALGPGFYSELLLLRW